MGEDYEFGFGYSDSISTSQGQAETVRKNRRWKRN